MSNILEESPMKEILDLMKVKSARRNALLKELEQINSELYALGQVSGIIALYDPIEKLSQQEGAKSKEVTHGD